MMWVSLGEDGQRGGRSDGNDTNKITFTVQSVNIMVIWLDTKGFY